ncbi:MAG: PAS domain-containing sensor histidine kinase [Sulfitobacter sp.]
MSLLPPSYGGFRADDLDFVASPVFVLEPDAQGCPRYVAFNATARAISKRPLADYLGRTALEVYPGGLGRTAFERHKEVARTGQAITYEIDLPIGGTTRAVRTTLMPQKRPDGLCRLFGTSADLTEERKSLVAQVSIKTIATEMEQFVSMAAHDLRAPMRNIALIADMLRDGFVDQGDGKLELIDMLEEVADKSKSLIADVLSHANAIDTTQTTKVFNFAALCRDLCDVLDPHGQHHFTYTAVELKADRTAFQIAVRNLIDNALKHGNRDGMHIDITVQRGKSGMLDVILTDDGKGFSDAALAFLNGGAFRVDSGYGLLGVRRMIAARGGTMSAGNAAKGQGAVIRFSMPGAWVTPTHSLGEALPCWSPDTIQPNSKSA